MEEIRLPKAEKHEMRVLDREEQTRLILAARRAPEPAAFGIIFDLFTGLRMGELCGLRWENVDMDGRSLSGPVWRSWAAFTARAGAFPGRGSGNFLGRLH